MEQVLPFENVPYDEVVNITNDISQMTAEQYFSWVRDQSSRMPQVFRASEETIASISITPMKTLPPIEEIPECPVDLLPSMEWERSMIHSFSELRSTIATKSVHYKERSIQVPQMKDRQAWLSFCLGSLGTTTSKDCKDDRKVATGDTSPIESEECLNVRKRKRELAADLGIELDDPLEDEENFVDLACGEEELDEDDDDEEPTYSIWEGPIGLAPSLKLLLQLDQVLTQKVLMYLVEWLHDNCTDENGFTEKIGQWIYSLLARVEKPLHRDTVALIRQLYRCSCVIRNQLVGKTADDVFERKLATLNTLISISGYYFGQGEYYKSFQPIIDVDVDQKPKNLLLDGSSDEDDDDAMNNEVGDRGEDDCEQIDEPPTKWRAFNG